MITHDLHITLRRAEVSDKTFELIRSKIGLCDPPGASIRLRGHMPTELHFRADRLSKYMLKKYFGI